VNSNLFSRIGVKSSLMILCMLAGASAATARQEVQKDDQDAPRMSVAELLSRLEKHAPVVIVDARSEGSWEGSDKQIKGSIRIPVDQIEARMSDLPKDKEIIFYCS
jgi:3-mercaptopyruvate sulfurtransferase SseA